MTKEEALKLVEEYNNTRVKKVFLVGDTCFLVEQKPLSIQCVKIKSKRHSTLGFPTCYSVYNKKTNKLRHGINLLLFKTRKEALKILKALKVLKAEEKIINE